MTSPAWELQQAAYTALVSDAALVDELGGTRVYDAVPRGAAFPYLTFGPITTRDWSTGTEIGAEHTLILRAWSKAGGTREVHRVLERVRQSLVGASLTLNGHRVVNVQHEQSDAAREIDGETWSGAVRFRVVTEPVP